MKIMRTALYGKSTPTQQKCKYHDFQTIFTSIYTVCTCTCHKTSRNLVFLILFQRNTQIRNTRKVFIMYYCRLTTRFILLKNFGITH